MIRPRWHRPAIPPPRKLPQLRAAVSTGRGGRRSKDRRAAAADNDVDIDRDDIFNAKEGAREMWPHLKRRARPGSPSRPASWNASSTAHGIDVDADDKTFAAALSRTGSTKDEFMARSSLANAFRTDPTPPPPSQDVSVWAKLESSAKLLRKPGRRGHAAAAAAAVDERQTKSLTRGDRKNMLIIKGLSTNLVPSDFSRLDPSGLAQWGSAFKKVQQHRHLKTLEPLGNYQISFETSPAASAYMDKVQRLQRAAHHRAQSPSGLWQSTLPSQHRQAPSSSTSSESEKLGVSGDALEAALEAYTIAPPSEAALSIERTRTSLRFPWANRLSNLLQPLGHGPRPPTVLLQVYPPGPSEADIAHFIRQDGRQRDLPWKTSAPQSLRRLEGNEDVAAAAEDISYSNRSAAARDRKYDLEDEAAENEDADNGTEADLDDMADEPTGEKSIRLLPSGKARQRRALEQVDSRFVIVCDTDWEARRFHRGWNQRVMTTTTQGEVSRYMIRVSVIEW